MWCGSSCASNHEARRTDKRDTKVKETKTRKNDTPLRGRVVSKKFRNVSNDEQVSYNLLVFNNGTSATLDGEDAGNLENDV